MSSTASKRHSWWFRLLLALATVMFAVLLFCGWLLGTQSGLRSALNLSRAYLPDGIRVGQVSGRLAGRLLVADLQLDLQSVEGSVKVLEIDWQPALLLKGVLQIDSVMLSGVDVQLLAADAPEQPQPPFELPDALVAPLDIVLKQLLVKSARLHSGETTLDISSLEAGASWLDTRVVVDRLLVTAPLFDVDAVASVDAQENYPLEIDARLIARPPDFAEITTRLEVSGDAHGPKLQLNLQPPYRTDLTAQIGSLFTAPTLTVRLEASPEPLNLLSATLPALTPELVVRTQGQLDSLEVAAELDLRGENVPASRTELLARLGLDGLEISRLEAQIESQPQPVMMTGQIGFADLAPVDLQLSWPELLFPTPEGELGLHKGQLQLRGTLAAYNFSAETELDYLGQHNPVTLAGTGTQTSVQLERLRAGMGEGELNLNGSAEWSDGLTATMTLAGRQVNPGLYFSDFPGALDLNLELDAAQSRSGDWSGQLRDLNASGEVADLPVFASGAASVSGDNLRAEKINLKLGDNALALEGRLGALSDFGWTLNLTDLAQFSAIAGVKLAGSVTGKGRITGASANPQLEAAVYAQGLLLAQQQIELIELTLNGQRSAHAYDLHVETLQADLTLEGTGDFAADNRWLYQVDELLLSHPDLDPAAPLHEWAMQASARGRVAAGLVQIEPLCLRHRAPREGGSVCLEVDQEGDALSVAVSLDALQLANLNALLPSGMRIDGEIAGDLSWAGAVEKTAANLRINGLYLALQEKDVWLDALKFAPSTLVLAPVNQGLELALRFPLQNGLEHSGVFATGRMSPLVGQSIARWPIESQLNLELPELGWLAAFSDQLETFEGALSGGVALSGTAEHPKLQGSTLLAVPVLSIAELGIELRDTRFELTGTDEGLKLLGDMHSGKGGLKLAADMGWNDGLFIEGSVNGENFTVSDSPLARATVSPDMRVTFANNKLILRGEVLVPLADIHLAKIPDGAVSASRDQRFVVEQQASTPLDLDARIRVVLGDNVRFEGLGLQASFGGALTVSDQTAGTTTGKGEIVIKKGTYKAYGQDLSVQDGRIIFAGGPVDEPGLDVRAVRQATTDILVGVQVRGTLTDPTLEVFSTPSLPQSDQLSYLVLGRSLASSSESENSVLQQAAMAIGVEGGTLLTDRIGKNLGVDSFGIESAPGTGAAQAALVVGKYLSPRLYVSYGYGLFEPISTLRMEYQLSKLWRIVTQSTNEATGGDFFWVRER